MKRTGVWALLAATVALAVGAAYMASAQPFFAGDPTAAEWIVGAMLPGLGVLMTVASWSGIYAVAVVSYVLLLPMAVRWHGRDGVALLLATAALDITNEGLKALVGRPRPVPAYPGEGGSFPSGHTVHAVLFLGLLWMLLEPRVQGRGQRAAMRGLFVVLALLVGLSRVYLERHWPSDVLGGFLVGGLVLLGLSWWWRRRRAGGYRSAREA